MEPIEPKPASEIAPAPAAETRHPFEFRGTGAAYFGIWIVNLVLTVVTLGIFSAWAKVRTRRYFNGSTWLAGHAFDYHASPVRILIGRTIAFVLLLAYSISVHFSPLLGLVWFLAGLWIFPWLANSSIRFNARNTSYRNVRFNFTATEVEAFVALIVWWLVGMITLGIMVPFAQRQKDYYYINNHTYGGRYFETKFPVWRMYVIFGIGLVAFVVLFGSMMGLVFSLAWTMQQHFAAPPLTAHSVTTLAVMAVFYIGFLLIPPAIHTMIVNLSVSHTVFDDKHRLESTMSPLMMAWIIFSNVVLCIVTIGFFYPWARVRLARYQMAHLTLIAEGDIDAYVSEVFETQSAVGEEIGSVFSFDFGL